MGHLLYLMFRCDFNVMENLESLEEWEETKHSLAGSCGVLVVQLFAGAARRSPAAVRPGFYFPTGNRLPPPSGTGLPDRLGR